MSKSTGPDAYRPAIRDLEREVVEAARPLSLRKRTESTTLEWVIMQLKGMGTTTYKEVERLDDALRALERAIEEEKTWD